MIHGVLSGALCPQADLLASVSSRPDVLLGAYRDWNAAVSPLALGKLEGQ